MLSALGLLPSQDNDQVAKTPHGTNSTKKFPKDSEIYFRSSDNSNTTANHREKNIKNAFIWYIASLNILKGWVFMAWETWWY